MEEAILGCRVHESVQLFLQLALILLQPPLILQEFTLLHLQLPHLFLADLELVLQFCQLGQHCITLWVGWGMQAWLLCEVHFWGASRAPVCSPASCEFPGFPSSSRHLGLIIPCRLGLYAKGKPQQSAGCSGWAVACSKFPVPVPSESRLRVSAINAPPFFLPVFLSLALSFGVPTTFSH